MELSTSDKWHYQALTLTLNQKIVNLSPLTMKFCLLISTYPKSAMHAILDNFRLW